MDVGARREVVATARGKPSMLQLQAQPAYSLTIHKVQSLTIKHTVRGCLEGVFAHGQIYVLISRVTDPKNFVAVGLPPEDLLDAVAEAWAAAGIDVNAQLEKAVQITDEWTYERPAAGADLCQRVRDRLKPKHTDERRVPLRLKSTEQT